jgi:uncharacterized Tic20 family protein
MLLQIFILMMSVCLCLIALGLYAREHTELTLIGFFLMFMISFTLIGNNLEIKTGGNSTTNFIYANTSSLALNYTHTSSIDIYNPYAFSGTLSHTIGYYLLVASAVGFTMVFWNLKKSQDI